MKHRLLSLLLAAALVLCGLSVPAAAADAPAVQITVNGTPVTFDSDLGMPYIDENGRTMVPFRAVANFMDGIKVHWDDVTREARFTHVFGFEDSEGMEGICHAEAIFPIGTQEMWSIVRIVDIDSFLDPELVAQMSDVYLRLTELDTKVVIRDGRTYAPIRYLAEAFGYTVGWDEETHTVTLDNAETDFWDGCSAWIEENQHIVTSREAAELYARECVRYTFGDWEPEVTYGDFEETEAGDAWRLTVRMKLYKTHQAAPSDEVNTGVVDIFVTERGEIYYKILGHGEDDLKMFSSSAA